MPIETKKTGQYLSRGDEIGQGLVAKLTSSHHQTCEESPKGQRDPREGCGPSRSKAHQKDGEDEEITLSCPGHEREDAGHQHTGCHEYAGEDRHGSADGRQDLPGRASPPRQKGHRQDHWDHA
jgi:hypothetical protein